MKTRGIFLILVALFLDAWWQAAGQGPTLSFHLASDGQLTVSWLDTGQSYALEVADRLDPSAWQLVPGVPPSSNGQFGYVVPAGSRMQFFRLAQSAGPRLAFQLESSGLLAVSWPDTGQPYVLEVADQLTSNAWRSASPEPTLSNGQFAYVVQVGSQMQFFRLAQSAGPRLAFQLESSGLLTVSWQDTGQPFVLEVADQLAPNAWHSPAAQPALSNGRFALSVQLGSRMQFFRLRAVGAAVEVKADLASDTGVSSTDGITSIVTISGQVSNLGSIGDFVAGFDTAPATTFLSIRHQVQPDGTFALDSATIDLISGNGLADGPHTLHLVAKDASRQTIGSTNLSFTLDTTPPQVIFSPADEEQDVLPRQLVITTFNEAVAIQGTAANGFTNNPAGLLAVTSSGADVPGRLVLDQTGMRLTFVPAQDLAGGAEYEVQLDPSRVFDLAGNPALVTHPRITFRTANNEGIPGTSLAGWVFDSTRGVLGNEVPVVGATITVVGSDVTPVVTDTTGKFQLENVPGGQLLIEVDGTTAQAPPGSFYPSVTKTFSAVAATAGLIDSAIYLPLVQNSAFVSLSPTTPTTVANPGQLPGWSLDVPPDTVQRRDGSTASKLLMAPVSPDRLPAPLPPGVDPKTVITIQADGGADVFTQPVPLTAPNLEGLPPGSKTVLWDFDHARGQFVPVASATVSADGKTVTTDPGQGVVRPGWHFFLNLIQGIVGASGGNAYNKPNLDSQALFNCTVKLTLSTSVLVSDLTQFAPGPLGLVSSLLNGVADGARKSIDNPEEQAQNVKDAIRDATVDGLDKIGESWSEAAEQLENAATPLRNGEAAEKLAEINEKAAQIAGNTGFILKSVGGAFSIYKLAKEGPEQIKRWNEDVECLSEVLKDPPGDAIDRTLRALSAAQDAVSSVNFDAVPGTVADLLEAGAALTRIYAAVVDPPGTRPIVDPEKSQLESDAIEASTKYARATAALNQLQAQTDAAVAAVEAMQTVVAGNESGRLYGTFATGASPATSTVGAGALQSLPTSVNSPGTPVTLSGLGRLELTEPSGTVGVITVVDPVANLIGSETLQFPQAVLNQPLQTQIEFPPVLLMPSHAPDLNGNGLPDDLDVVLGNPTRAQVAALRNGLPADEVGIAALGIVGRLSQRTQLTTNSFLENSYADLVPGDGVLYGIGGSNSFEVIDISRPTAPVKIAHVSPGSGYAGVERGGRLAVMGFGLQVYDVSDGSAPKLIRQFDYTQAGFDHVRPVLGPNHVVVSKGTDLISFDLDTGEQVSTVSLATIGTPVRLEANGDIIYVLTFQPLPNLQFSVTTIRFDAAGQLTFLGEVRPFFWSSFSLPKPFGLAVDDRAAFVGPWLISVDPFAPGFGTIDISDPTKPVVIATPSTNNVTGAAMLATDNCGHLLTTVANTAQNQILDLFDVHDLTQVTNQIFTLPLDHQPYAPGFSAGLAVFATESDIWVARVVPMDTGSQPPTISDVQLPNGTVLNEGRRFGVHVRATDDVQVARVELFLQGDNRVASDASYPFDLDFLPPASLPEGQALTLTVRATDTGGNRAERTFNLTYHAKPPRLGSITPPPGFTTKLPLTNAVITFDKPLNRSFISTNTFDLRGAGPDKLFDTSDDVHVPIASVTVSSDDTQITLDFGKALPVDQYRLTVASAGIRDRGGNPLDGDYSGSLPSGNGTAGGDFVTTFEVRNVPVLGMAAIPLRTIRTDPRDYSGFDTSSLGSPLVVADMNGDGRLDFLRAIYAAPSDTNEYHAVTVTLQKQDGTYADPVTYPVPNYPIRVLTGDVNGDGHPDVVTIHVQLSSSFPNPEPRPFGISVLLGNADGTLQTPRTNATQGQLLLTEGAFLLGNFTGSGRADLAQLIPDLALKDESFTVTNRAPAQLLIYPAQADGTFGKPVVTMLAGSTNFDFPSLINMAAADLNGDGKLDLVIPSVAFDLSGYVLLGQGDGTFATLREPLLKDSADPPVLADFNSDGKVDVIFGKQLLRGSGDGHFVLVPNEGFKSNGLQPFGSDSAVVADFNGDGHPDYAAYVASLDFTIQGLGIFTNKTDGTFGLMTTVMLDPALLQGHFLAADLNGDRAADLLFDTGDGSNLPFSASTLYAEANGVFPTIPSALNAQQIETLDTPLLADLNRDGIPDLFGPFLDPNPERAVAVLLSTPGGFGQLTTNAIGTSDPNFFIRGLGAGDFNGDGKIDIVAAQFNSSFASDNGAVYLMLGHGDGTLQQGLLIPGITNLAAVADFNGDGHPDLLSFDFVAGVGVALGVHLGKGDGTFAPPILTSDPKGAFSTPPLIGDFNNDGKLDLLFSGSGAVQVWLSDGTGRFTLGSSSTGLPIGWELQALGDFNNDGKLDVLMNDRSGEIDTYQLRVLPGDGTGKLGAPLAPTPFPGAYNSKGSVVDINHDGSADLVIMGRFGGNYQEARVSLGNGDGTFQPPISFLGLSAGNTVIAADFTGDGLIDLLVGQSLLIQR